MRHSTRRSTPWVVLFLGTALAVWGCGARPPGASMVARPLSATAADTVARATETFYAAESHAALRRAVDEALTAAPRGARALGPLLAFNMRH